VTTLDKSTYRLAPWDTLAVNVQGRSVIGYLAKPEAAQKDDPTLIRVSPTGEIYLPLLGSINVVGKTVAVLEEEVRDGLAKYFKHFTVSITLVGPRPLYVSISGSVANPGIQSLNGIPTVSSFAIRSGILASGSMRRIELLRENKTQTIDLYRILVLGDLESDTDLQPGDKMFVPAVTRNAYIFGEVIRPGQYEMVSASGKTEDFRVRDLLELAIGTTPAAALDKATVERIGSDEKRVSIPLDLSKADAPGADMILHPGDILNIPSISAYQPIIWMVGEFTGTGVYQRSLPSEAGKEKVVIQNKRGIYSLKQGQTVGDVIRATGGVTPQANLKRAYIERVSGTKRQTIPVDLEKILIQDDRTADVLLENGDYLILPALEDKVHILGEVRSPGSFDYSPSRRLIDYIGDAGGTTERSKLGEIRLVRGSAISPQVTKLNLNDTIKHASEAGNPVLQPGDIVYVPSKVIGGWHEGLQVIFEALSMAAILHNGL